MKTMTLTAEQPTRWQDTTWRNFSSPMAATPRTRPVRPTEQCSTFSALTTAVSFAGGSPAPEMLPQLGFRLKERATQSLKGQIAVLVHQRGMNCLPSDVLVTQGAQQAIDLICQKLLTRGSFILTDRFTDPVLNNAVRSRNAAAIAMPMLNETDIDVERVRRSLRTGGTKPAFIYLTPEGGNPSGASMSEAQRTELLGLAFVKVSDPHRRRRFKWIPGSPGHGHDRFGRPRAGTGPAHRMFRQGARSASGNRLDDRAQRLQSPLSKAWTKFRQPLSQRIVAGYLDEGCFEYHLRRRPDGLPLSLQSDADRTRGELPRRGSRVSNPSSGMFVWVEPFPRRSAWMPCSRPAASAESISPPVRSSLSNQTNRKAGTSCV